MSLLTDIPGYAEAVNAEQANRELAFLPTPPPICGVPVRHLNARHHILLAGCGNRFVCGGGRPSEADALFLLWVISPEYSMDRSKRDAWMAGRLKEWDFYQVASEIFKYLERVWQDWPRADGVQRKGYTASVAGLVDVLASEYGWSDEAILELPLARVFQYVRRIIMRHNPKAIMFNQSDRLLTDHLLARTEQAKTVGTTH